MTILHYYDIYGWYTSTEIPDRSTELGPSNVPAERVVGQPWPNFTGETWALQPYSEPPAQPEQPKAPRLVTVGAFFDRFGPLKWEILADQSPLVQAVIRDAQVRKHIDLDNPDLPGGLSILQSAGHQIDAAALIDAPVQPHEVP
ncbi:hypothetical protein [Acidovorax sp.]|uniref:hypothetical protein n=1 Tax=Acidovorax sp. TaxID=1872122 RepID=UPI0025C3B4CE|nr:hypothetical protein [Acidovorax sp.]MBW8465490.1 hypothetical protein [Acidovorax sp.]